MTKFLRINFSNGEAFDLPCQVIAENRARYYAAKDPETTYEAELAYTLSDDYELRDWFGNNMNVGDYKDHLVRISGPQPVPFEDGVNDEDTIIEVQERPQKSQEVEPAWACHACGYPAIKGVCSNERCVHYKPQERT